MCLTCRCGSHLICEPPFACVLIIVSLVISAGGQERPGHCTRQPSTLAGQQLTMMCTVAVTSIQQVECISLVCVITVTTSDVISIIGGTMANIDTHHLGTGSLLLNTAHFGTFLILCYFEVQTKL